MHIPSPFFFAPHSMPLMKEGNTWTTKLWLGHSLWGQSSFPALSCSRRPLSNKKSSSDQGQNTVRSRLDCVNIFSLPGFKSSPSAETSSFAGSFFLLSALMINVLKLYPFNSGHLILGTFIKEDFSNPYFFTAYNRSLSVVASTTFVTGIIQVGPASKPLKKNQGKGCK